MTELTDNYSLFDSHCHFDFEAFDGMRDQIWQECQNRNIRQLLIPGTSPDHWLRQQQLSKQYDGVYRSIGIHPWYLPENDDDNILEVMSTKLSQESCIAIGECGLDKTIATPMKKQIVHFEQHLALAQDTAMPLIVHAHKAHNEVLTCLKRFKLTAGGVIHAFSGSLQMAMDYWKLGFRLGIGGVITYPRANKTRITVKQLPLEAILLETDAPDMPLNGHQGQSNSPIHIYHVALCLAELRGESLKAIAQHTTSNAEDLFQLPKSQ